MSTEGIIIQISIKQRTRFAAQEASSSSLSPMLLIAYTKKDSQFASARDGGWCNIQFDFFNLAWVIKAIGPLEQLGIVCHEARQSAELSLAKS